MPRCSAALVLLVGLGSGLAAQTAAAPPAPPGSPASPPHRSHLEGKWQAKTEDEIRNIMVRGDSSAQFGEQVARWRIIGDSLWLALRGGGGQGHGVKVGGGQPPPAGGGLGEARTPHPR